MFILALFAAQLFGRTKPAPSSTNRDGEQMGRYHQATRLSRTPDEEDGQTVKHIARLSIAKVIVMVAMDGAMQYLDQNVNCNVRNYDLSHWDIDSESEVDLEDGYV